MKQREIGRVQDRLGRDQGLEIERGWEVRVVKGGTAAAQRLRNLRCFSKDDEQCLMHIDKLVIGYPTDLLNLFRKKKSDILNQITKLEFFKENRLVRKNVFINRIFLIQFLFGYDFILSKLVIMHPSRFAIAQHVYCVPTLENEFPTFTAKKLP